MTDKKGKRRMDDEKIPSRVASLEVGQNALHDDMNKLSNRFDSLSHEVKNGFDNLYEKLGKQNTTDWGVLLSAGALVVAIISLGFSGYVRDLGRVDNDVEKLEKSFNKHITLGGHPVMIEQTKANKESIEKLSKHILEREKLNHRYYEFRLNELEDK